MEWLASDFVHRCRQGEHPTIAEYVARYPEYAASIRDLLPAVVMLEQLRNGEQTGRKASIRELSEG